MIAVHVGLIAAFMTATIYGFSAFATWSLDPGEWDPSWRLAVAFLWFIFMFAIGVGLAVETGKRAKPAAERETGE